MNKKVKEKSISKLAIMLYILISITIGAVGFLFYQLNQDSIKHSVSSVFQKEKTEKLFPLEDFAFQLADGHYAKLSLSLGYLTSSDKEEEAYKEATPILRDKVLMELMKMHSYQLKAEEINKTKITLIESLKPIMKDSDIVHLYMESLVVQ